MPTIVTGLVLDGARARVVEAEVEPLADRELPALGGAGGDEHLVRRVRTGSRPACIVGRSSGKRSLVGGEQGGGEDVVDPVRRAGEPGVHALVDDALGRPPGPGSGLRAARRARRRHRARRPGEDPVVGGVGPPRRGEARDEIPNPARGRDRPPRWSAMVGESSTGDDDDRPHQPPARLVTPVTLRVRLRGLCVTPSEEGGSDTTVEPRALVVASGHDR